MLKRRVLLWTRGQTWVVVGFLTLVWYVAYKLIMESDAGHVWFWRGVAVLILALPVVVARILFIAYGAREIPPTEDGTE